MFSKAQRKLTLSYIVIIALISFTVSGVIYGQVENTAKNELIKQDLLIEKRFKRVILNDSSLKDQILQSDKTLNEIRKNTLISLGLFNLFILFLTSIIGYWYAGKTLKPIQENDLKQKQFLANAAHELKTPLTSLKMQMEVGLRNPELRQEEVKEIFKSSIEDINYLNKIIGNFLTIGKLQENTNNLKIRKFELKSSVNQVFLRFKERLLNKKIIVENKIVNVEILADEFLLNEVFAILIDNSIKYLKNYGVIEITYDKKNDCHLITFKDNGSGISKEDLPNIFDRFYKSDKSRNKDLNEGFGLGLSIAKDIISKHQGTISCESELGKFTAFYIKLPIIK